MGVRVTGLFAALSFAAFGLQAAPKLRLTQTAIGPVSFATGTNGTIQQTVEAYNAGDGSLSLKATSNVTWISPSIGAAHACSSGSGSCFPVNLALQTSSLAAGTYTGTVTIADPNALDAPQTITVTVQPGGAVPDSLSFYVAPNGSSQSASFTAGKELAVTTATQSGGQWLSVRLEGGGSFRFSYPYTVNASHLSGMAEGTYNGTIRTANSNLASENKTVNVALRVTSQPISQAAVAPFKIAQNTPKQTQNILIANAGLGKLAVSGVTAATQSGGNWLMAKQLDAPYDSYVAVTADPTSASPGLYQGTVTVASNAANGSLTIPVRLEVTAQASPTAFYQGVVNNATFEAGPVAQGELVALFGDQLAYADPKQATTLPLPTDLSGAKVYVNDRPAPIYYASYSQINFQIPYDAAIGDAVLRVERDGQRGNSIGVPIVKAAARLMRLGIGDYGIIINPDGSFAVPSSIGIGHPAKAGDTQVVYALGLGPTVPVVATGAGAPGGPLAQVAPTPQVYLGGSVLGGAEPITPLFVGLTPGFVGLYQINFTIPDSAPRGNMVPMSIDGGTNRVNLAIQ